MFIPKIYENQNLEEVKQFIQENSFGILVTQQNGKSLATHIPLELSKNETGKDVLVGHIAKANPQWHNFKDEGEILAIFNGPHSYVSSSWYDFEEVPTWNYVAVHVYGKIKTIEGEALYKSLKDLMDKYEKGSKNPVKIEDMSKKTMRQINGIVGFKIEITDIQAAFKLSQNRDDKNHKVIVDELKNTNNSGSKAIAQHMKKERNK
jgi:transcriptional regulator